MFGLNKLYSPKDFVTSNLFIKDIFYTIQGEAIFGGMPSTFIRLAYCNMKCSFCDTNFESNISQMTIDEILTKVKMITPSHTNLIVITGGEPLLQPAVSQLCNVLLENNFVVQIETAGTVFPKDLPVNHNNFYIVCSPKTGKLNSKIEQWISAYKYIISEKNYSDEDGLPVESAQTNNHQKLARPLSRATPIYVAPMDEYDEEQNKLNVEAVKKIALKYGYRISLQIHKIIGVE